MGVANNLVAMVRSSSRGQLASLERLLGMLVEGDYITAPVIKCLWDIFQQSSADSALAVQVLSMIGSVSRDVINNNFDLLVRIGVSGQDDRRGILCVWCVVCVCVVCGSVCGDTEVLLSIMASFMPGTCLQRMDRSAF